MMMIISSGFSVTRSYCSPVLFFSFAVLRQLRICRRWPPPGQSHRETIGTFVCGSNRHNLVTFSLYMYVKSSDRGKRKQRQQPFEQYIPVVVVVVVVVLEMMEESFPCPVVAALAPSWWFSTLVGTCLVPFILILLLFYVWWPRNRRKWRFWIPLLHTWITFSPWKCPFSFLFLLFLSCPFALFVLC